MCVVYTCKNGQGIENMEDWGIEYARIQSTNALRFKYKKKSSLFVVIHKFKTRSQTFISKSSCRAHPSPLVCICILSNILPFRPSSLTSIPTNAPCVVSNSKGPIAFQIFKISSGGKGIMLGIDHWKE